MLEGLHATQNNLLVFVIVFNEPGWVYGGDKIYSAGGQVQQPQAWFKPYLY